MKKLSILLLMLFYSFLYADILPDPDVYHRYKCYVGIVNTDDYPDNVFLSVVHEYNPTELSYIYQITSEWPYIMHSSGFSYFIAMKKTLYNRYVPEGNTLKYDDPLGGILLQYAEDKQMVSINLVPENFIENVYPITEDNRTYIVTSVNDRNVTLRLQKRVITFDDGKQKTITY